MKRDFWKSAGAHLCEVDKDGWLTVTPDLLRAYFTRPEVHPVEESCAEEHRLFEEVMADPFADIVPERLSAIADPDAAENYKIVLTFRDYLRKAGTIEGAYLDIMKSGVSGVPPVFLDQLVHLILHNILRRTHDPIRLRAGEIFFREQNVSTEGGRIMLADEEIVEMHAKTGGMGALGQLLVDSATPMKNVELDVLDEDNKDIYWERSDRFDTVVDFRFTQPALDAFARVIEAWVGHFLGLDVRIQPRQSIQDDHWSWHVGLDRESTAILNALYEDKPVSADDAARLIALFRMEIEDKNAVLDTMRGKPIYLALGMTPSGKVVMKPQNLLTNLPLKKKA